MAKTVIITDSQFDTSADPNNQEQYHFRLILQQVICALKLQKELGIRLIIP